MATTIVTKNSSTAAAVPTAGQLVQGELAVNVADKRLFTEDNGGTIVEVGTNPSTIDINSGTIDGTTIGASSASTGAFTTLTATGAFTSRGIDDNADAIAITIDSSENVGIGDTSPSVKLDVYQSTAGTGAVDFRHVNGNRILINPSYNYHDAYNHIFRGLNGTGTHMTIDNLGNVGIAGQTNPTYKLDGGFADQTWGWYLNSSYNAGFTYNTAERSLLLATKSAENIDHIKFATGSAATERVRITGVGNVGIGIASPLELLHIQSGTTSPAILVKADGQAGNTTTTAELILGVGPISSNDSACKVISYRIGDYSSAAVRTSGLKFQTTNANAPVDAMSLDNSGNLSVLGSLSKGSGSFKINHPLPEKTETHHLVHSFVEAPQADNIYRGKVALIDGVATVNIDTVAGMTEGTYVLLNTNTQCFTSNESGWTAVKGSVSGNILTITSQESCSDTISWMVVGERHDQHMLDTEWTDETGKVIVEPSK